MYAARLSGGFSRRLQALTAFVVCVSVVVSGCAGSDTQTSTPAQLSHPATITATASGSASGTSTPIPASGVLPSWQDGPARAAILRFIDDVTTQGSPHYVEPEARVAVFDNDGTLWSEAPMPFQLVFMIEQVKTHAQQHPEWKRNPAFQALMSHDEAALAKNKKPFLDLLAQANSGMSTDEYDQAIRAWLVSAKHPRFDRPYTALVYQPQLELLSLLKTKGFTVWIVSGGTAEFMRVWASQAYGIPPEHVVGTEEKLRYTLRDGKPILLREPGFAFVDDGPGKPVGIFHAIGRRPILAFGNSDGDREMLEYTTSGPGETLGLLVHHDDAEREFAYDRASALARLDKAWDQAQAQGWIVVSMKSDWKTVYPNTAASGSR